MLYFFVFIILGFKRKLIHKVFINLETFVEILIQFLSLLMVKIFKS
jgi:hypothetical protein